MFLKILIICVTGEKGNMQVHLKQSRSFQDVEIICRTGAIVMNIHTGFLREPIQLIKNTSIMMEEALIRASFLRSSNNMKDVIWMELLGSVWIQH